MKVEVGMQVPCSVQPPHQQLGSPPARPPGDARRVASLASSSALHRRTTTSYNPLPTSSQYTMSLVDGNTILAFKAGRCFRHEGTNTVDPNPTKGAIVLEREEDELLHFYWKNRETGVTEDVCNYFSYLFEMMLMRVFGLVRWMVSTVGPDLVSVRCIVREGIAGAGRKSLCA